jgi:hypothetical protein
MKSTITKVADKVCLMIRDLDVTTIHYFTQEEFLQLADEVNKIIRDIEGVKK